MSAHGKAFAQAVRYALQVNVTALYTRLLIEKLRRLPAVDQRVVDAIGRVDRRAFVPRIYAPFAYADRPVGIGHGQTISQPSMIAIMLSAARIAPTDRVLEIGTGSGYGAAVLAQLAASVVSVERISTLAYAAFERLARLGIDRIEITIGDGSTASVTEGTFDAIVVTAAAPRVPARLIERLREGGRLIVPVGDLRRQALTRVTLHAGKPIVEQLEPCSFVPLVGADAWKKHQTSQH